VTGGTAAERIRGGGRVNGVRAPAVLEDAGRGRRERRVHTSSKGNARSISSRSTGKPSEHSTGKPSETLHGPDNFNTIQVKSPRE
jgi:hypothetical protein